jgi:hypothetical protein
VDGLDTSIEFLETEFIKVIQHFKKYKKLNAYNSFIRKYVYSSFKTDDMSHIQTRLFITYYDTKKYKKRTVSNYKNREHLISCIIKSGYIPYITDGNTKYKNRYIDGITPHIFPKKKNREILYVDMMHLPHLFGCISIDIKRIYKRVFIGAKDAGDFFTTGNSSICGYMKDITYTRQIVRTLTEIVFFIVLFITDVISSIHFNTNMIFSESVIYNTIYTFFYTFFEGILDFVIMDGVLF